MAVANGWTTRWRRQLIAGALFVLALAGLLAAGIFGDTRPAVPTKDPAGYVERLESHLRGQPRDFRGWVLLARAYADDGRYADAARAFERAAASPKVAKDPAVLCEYADAVGMSQGGRLDGRPSELIAQALAIDPAHPIALEMAGSAAYADGRYAESVRYWQALLKQLEPQTQRHAELSAAIRRAERQARVALPTRS